MRVDAASQSEMRYPCKRWQQKMAAPGSKVKWGGISGEETSIFICTNRRPFMIGGGGGCTPAVRVLVGRNYGNDLSRLLHASRNPLKEMPTNPGVLPPFGGWSLIDALQLNFVFCFPVCGIKCTIIPLVSVEPSWRGRRGCIAFILRKMFESQCVCRNWTSRR